MSYERDAKVLKRKKEKVTYVGTKRKGERGHLSDHIARGRENAKDSFPIQKRPPGDPEPSREHRGELREGGSR